MDRPLSILLVDDSAMDALLTEKLIARDRPDDVDIRITRARTLREARAALCVAIPDCIVQDWNLPDSRGDRDSLLITEARGAPVVVLSGSSDPEIEKRAITSGASAFVLKKTLNESDNLFALLHRLSAERCASGNPIKEETR